MEEIALGKLFMWATCIAKSHITFQHAIFCDLKAPGPEGMPAVFYKFWHLDGTQDSRGGPKSSKWCSNAGGMESDNDCVDSKGKEPGVSYAIPANQSM